MCWTSRKNTASALSRYANPRFITIWRATRIGIHTNPSGWRGPKIPGTARSTTKLSRKLASADSTLAAGRSCSGIRTFFTSGAFARIADAPDCSDVAKNVHGRSPTNRKIAYGCSPDAVIGRVRRTTPKRIQNTTSCSSGFTKFHKKPSAEPLYRARSSRHAKSTSSSRRSTSTRRSAITVLSWRTGAGTGDFHASLLRHGQSGSAYQPPLARFYPHYLWRRHARICLARLEDRGIGIQRPGAGSVPLELRRSAVELLCGAGEL